MIPEPGAILCSTQCFEIHLNISSDMLFQHHAEVADLDISSTDQF